jgi:hypothetical protein
MSENGYEAAEQSVAAVHMFREGGKGWGSELKESSEEAKKEMEVVDGIYKETLGESMPTFVKAPKEDRYGYIGRKGRRVAV